MGSQPIGNPSQSAGTQFNHSCPPGHVIQRVDVRSGSVLDALKVQCTDGSSSPWYGGSGGAEGSYENTSGITGYGGRGAAFVDQLRVRSGYDHPGTWNTYGGTGGNEVSNFTCQQGEALQRVEGNYGQYVNRLQFWCGQFTQKQAIEAARAAAKAAEDAAKAAAEAAAKAAAEAAAKAAEEARLRAEKEQAEKVASMAATLKLLEERLAAAEKAAADAKVLAEASKLSATIAASDAKNAADQATKAEAATSAEAAGVAARAAEQSAANATSAAVSATKPLVTESSNPFAVMSSGGEIRSTPVGTTFAGANMWLLILVFIIILAVVLGVIGGEKPEEKARE